MKITPVMRKIALDEEFYNLVCRLVMAERDMQTVKKAMREYETRNRAPREPHNYDPVNGRPNGKGTFHAN